MYCNSLDLKVCASHAANICLFHVEIGQPKAPDKDIGLAWERIETFLWKHIGPASVAHSTDQQNENQVQGTVTQPVFKAENTNGATHISPAGGAQGA